MEEQVKTPHKIWAVVRQQFEGFHQWKDAPEEVSFLRNRHRHLFKVKVWIEQKHNDRDIEYFIFQRFVSLKIVDMADDLKLCQDQDGGASCETMATWLYYKIKEKYMKRQIKVEIYEDNENGAIAE